MSHPLFWPSKTFFYPIGNTAAISLTQDLSPEQPADILLLGCGDPRNILFTMFADVTISNRPRTLDVTCCDIEPAILARNILLFALLEAKEPGDKIWDIFYHFKINNQASTTITSYAKKLYESSDTIESWRQSLYGSFLKFVDTRTMSEVQRHWKSYADFSDLPSGRLNKLLRAQTALSKSVTSEYGHNLSPSRSAGMLWMHAATSVSAMFRRYWATGTIFIRDDDVKSAKNLNPTFIYSTPGEVFNPHYGTFPQGFHLTSAMVPFGSDTSSTTMVEAAIVKTMKQQFEAWANAFRASRAVGAVTVRFYSGDAIAFCRALDLFATTGNPATGVFVSAWRAAQANLDELSVSNPPAPTTFDIIDTSNLTDHLGLLNILLAAQPLLKRNPASQAVLYTETLLSAGEDSTKSFLDRICTSIPTISALLGLAPRAYVSAFTTQSNTHELLSPEQINQFHERVAWNSPSGGDHYAHNQDMVPSFDAKNLAQVLLGLYEKMFTNGQTMFSKPSLAELKSMIAVHYHRETLVMILHLVKRRTQLNGGDWNTVADHLLELIEKDRSQIFGSVYYQDICLQLHLYNIHTVATLQPDWREHFAANPSSDIFQSWASVPPALCIVMTVPRSKFQPFFKDKDAAGTPTLECHLTAKNLHSNAYSSVHVFWGKCADSQSSKTVVLEEDAEGIYGNSDLVVMFWASSRVLEFKNTSVSLALKSTPQSAMMFIGTLGMELVIFSAMLDDPSRVRILPYQPASASGKSLTLEASLVPTSTIPHAFSSLAAVTGSGGASRNVISFTSHTDIDLLAERDVLLNGAEVKAVQVSPCTMKLSIADHHHMVSYPYPILGSAHKLRIARKSHYVEIVVPVSEPLDSGGYHLDYAPIVRNDNFSPWNMHHISIERMPRIEAKDPKKLDWLNSHTALQLSDRERDVRQGDKVQKSAYINALVNVKDTIHALVMNFSGVQGTKTRVIGLAEPDQGGVYAMLFLGELRLDLASFTVIIDCALVPLSNERMPTLMPHIQRLQNADPILRISTQGHEMVAWKKLLPAFVERCRTWTHKANCEYTSRDKIPLTVEIDQNPICSCGQGIGFEGAEWKVAAWKGFLPFATRAAISPLFTVSYIETVAGGVMARISGRSGQKQTGAQNKKSDDSCWLCGSLGKPDLSKCGRCKKARYCSASCQHQDWPAHKGDCKKV